MRTAIILSTRGFQSFRFDLLKERRSVRFVGIFSEQDVNNLSADHRRHFDEIHTVRCGIPDDPSRLDSSTVDLEGTREVIRGVLAEAEPGTVTVHSYDEWNVLVAARLRTELDIPGPSYEDILPFRDKCLMKERLIEHGVRVPRFGRFEPEARCRDAASYFGQIVAHVGVPFILKPIDSAGSDGVHKITSWDEFEALGAFRRGYEYEELITGTIYSVNIVSRARKSLFAEVTEYLVNSFDVQSGKVNADINLHHADPRRARFVAFAETALAALGWPDGAFHLELFLTTNDEVVFLEVAARFKGLLGLAAMERNFGVNVSNLCFEVETGLASRDTDVEQVYCFDGVLPKKRGVVDQLVEPHASSQFEIAWKVQPGDKLNPSDSLNAHAGTFLMWNKDFEALYRDFKRLATYQPIVYRRP